MNLTRFFIHRFDDKEFKWKKAYRMCLTHKEASHALELLERSDKLNGDISNYRIQAISIAPISVKQLSLNF